MWFIQIDMYVVYIPHTVRNGAATAAGKPRLHLVKWEQSVMLSWYV